ncbi:MAG: uracil-DNA glycosylase [Sphingosinicella sp.]|uniref:uracil-DNA glycosylase n=1 Tax=Sphingosinicella sp. TaxID=1917971 RepID=UPI00403797A7
MTLQSWFELDELIRDVQECRRCPEMQGCTRVLSWANGSADAKIMFVGEAPGRLGADRTAIPFHGDKAGDNFERLLELGGFTRRQVFITNAVLCNPRDIHGNNAPPSKAALRNCAVNLQRQIQVVQPRLVVTLGGAALEATRLIENHDLSLSSDVRTARRWHGRVLIPLYHPGARAMIHRNFAAQTADYYFVGETYRRAGRARTTVPMQKPSSHAWDLVRFLVASIGRCSLFRLHKTMYLLDWKSVSDTGRRATDFVYIRQKDGPYCVELGSKWFKRFEPEIVYRREGAESVIEWQDRGLFQAPIPQVPDEVRKLVEAILQEIDSLTDAQLKTRSYLTKPMKDSLRAERIGSIQLNRPLL